MKKVILLAGYPATGKTYMSNVIKTDIPHSIYISQDEIKEILYDKIGFSNLSEKQEVIEYAREIFYDIVERSISQNEIVILDYPFSYKQQSFLTKLESKFEIEFLTIRLTGDLDTLYDRRIERDLAPTRNKAHILDSYHGYESYERDSYPLSRNEYKQNCIKGKYDQFAYGQLVTVDVTVYEKIDYQNIKQSVKQFISS